MSYAEVEMGLPPVNEVISSPTASLPQQRRAVLPNYEDIETDTARSSLERISSAPTPHTTATSPADRHAVFKVPSVQSPTRQRAPVSSPEQERVYSTEETDDSEGPPPEEDPISRARRFGGFVLILLPGLFGALAVQFINYILDYHHVYVLSLCVFQGILWPSVFFIFYTIYWMKRNVLKSIACTDVQGLQNMANVLMLGLLASCAVILQIVSLLHLDITVSLAITFSPLVFAALIEHIGLQRRFPLELLFTSLISYGGLIILCMSVITTGDGRWQRNLLVGLGTAIGSMTLTIPACLLLLKLRTNQVEDSLTAAVFSIIGTLLSLILMGAYLSFGASFTALEKSFESHPGFIATLVAFILCATFFLILDSIYRSPRPSNPATTRIILMLSATRMGVFVFSGMWEVLKRGIYPGYYTFPSVFSIFGVIFLLISHGLTVAYQAWYRQVIMPQIEEEGNNKPNRNRQPVVGKPFEFFPWLFSRSFI